MGYDGLPQPDAATDAGPDELTVTTTASAHFQIAATTELGPECQNIKSDAAGNVYITGGFQSLFFMDLERLSQGTQDSYVIAYDPQLNEKWMRDFGGANADIGVRLWPRQAGVTAQLMVNGNVTDHGVNAPQIGSTDHLLLHIDDLGVVEDYALFGSLVADRYGRGLVVSDSGTIVTGGGCGTGFSYGGDALDGSGLLNPCIGVLDDSFGHLQSWSWLADELSAVRGIAFGPGDDLIVALTHAGTVDFEGQLFESIGSNDALLLRWSRSGPAQWVTRVQGVDDETIQHVVADEERVFLALTSASPIISFEGQSIEQQPPDALVLAYGIDGGLLWSLPLSGSGEEWIEDIALLPNGDLAVVGGHEDGALLGDRLLGQSAFGQNAFVAIVSPQGQVRWTRSFASPGDGRAMAIQPSGADGMVLCAVVTGEVDLGTGPLEVANDERQVVVAHLTIE